MTFVAHDIGPVGGMERQVSELIAGCLEDGRSVTVVSRTCELPPHPRLRVHRVRAPASPFPVAYPWFELAAELVLRRHGRGVVHTAGAIVPRQVDVLTVHFCHRAFNALELGTRASRDTLAHRLNARLAVGIAEAGERWSFQSARARAVVAISDGVERELRRWYPELGARLSTIPHGVDTTRFRPDPEARAITRARLALPEDALVAVFVGGDWGRKGLEHAIAAVAATSRWRLLVVGDGDATRFGRLAEGLGVSDRVVFAGPSTDPSRELAAGDAFVLPTLYETFSLVSFEAAASGLPLLVTPVSGPGQLISEGVNGWFLDTSATRTAGLLDRLASDPELRARMGSSARDSALPYTWTATVQAHLDLYDELVRTGAGARTRLC